MHNFFSFQVPSSSPSQGGARKQVKWQNRSGKKRKKARREEEPRRKGQEETPKRAKQMRRKKLGKPKKYHENTKQPKGKKEFHKEKEKGVVQKKMPKMAPNAFSYLFQNNSVVRKTKVILLKYQNKLINVVLRNFPSNCFFQ